MKKTINKTAILLIVFASIISCKRENILKENSSANFPILEYVIGEGNTELIRLYNELYGYENFFTIKDNPNQGVFSKKPENMIFLSSDIEKDVSVKLNGNLYNKRGVFGLNRVLNLKSIMVKT